MKRPKDSRAVCALGLSSQAAHAAASPERFTAEFVSAFHEGLPTVAVTVTEPLRLTLKNPDGNGSAAFLDNAYNEYLHDPSAQDAIIRRYVASLADTSVGNAEPLDRQRIVPVSKDAAWPQEMRRSVGVGAAEQVVEAFNGDLVIVYAEDTPTNTRYFSPSDLADAGIARSALRNLAEENLRQMLPPVDGDIVVAVPTHDVLLCTGSRNAEGVGRIREMARKSVSEGTYTLTDRLFVYRDG